RLHAEAGLPANYTSALAQTADGYLWVATQRGLARYDGHSFTLFDHTTNPELGVREITELATDHQGRLLVATRLGLFRMNGRRFEPIGPMVIAGEPILAIAEDRSRAIWITTAAGPVRRADDGTITRFASPGGMPCKGT